MFSNPMRTARPAMSTSTVSPSTTAVTTARSAAGVVAATTASVLSTALATGVAAGGGAMAPITPNVASEAIVHPSTVATVNPGLPAALRRRRCEIRAPTPTQSVIGQSRAVTAPMTMPVTSRRPGRHPTHASATTAAATAQPHSTKNPYMHFPRTVPAPENLSRRTDFVGPSPFVTTVHVQVRGPAHGSASCNGSAAFSDWWRAVSARGGRVRHLPRSWL
jgi:hypothetical protein